MKKLLILIFALALITSCSNENPFARKDGKTVKDSKEAKDDRDKKDNDDDRDKDNSNSNWSSQFRNKQKDACMDEYRDDPSAKQICSCILEKMEQKYPNETDARTLSEDEADIVIEDCEQSAKNGINDHSGYIKRVERNDVVEVPANRKSWTDLQRHTFVQTCATAAQQQQGFTTRQANSYCDCMTSKVEQKYTFDQASRLTPADLDTQEWIDAAAKCKSRIY